MGHIALSIQKINFFVLICLFLFCWGGSHLMVLSVYSWLCLRIRASGYDILNLVQIRQDMHLTHYTIALVSSEVLLPVQQLNHMDKVTRFLEPHFLKLASGSFSPYRCHIYHSEHFPNYIYNIRQL